MVLLVNGDGSGIWDLGVLLYCELLLSFAQHIQLESIWSVHLIVISTEECCVAVH